MWKRKVRCILLATVIATLAGVAAPTSSSAFSGYFNCVLKPVGQWCDGRANGTYDGDHSWDYIEAWYPGAWDGTVTACEHAWKPSTGEQLGGGGTCDSNWTGHYYGNITCVCWEAEVRQYSGGAHSINGYADADF